MPFYLAQEATALGIYSEPADWITFELTHLLVAALSWNADLAADTYVNSYLRERYDAAAGAMFRYLQLVEEAGRLLFDRPKGNYDSLEVVTKVRALYQTARDVVGAAMATVDPEGTPAFLLARLNWNLDVALTDTAVSYHRLRGEREQAAKSRRLLQTLVDRHCLDGIVLRCANLVDRYRDPVERPDVRPMYDAYRDAW